LDSDAKTCPRNSRRLPFDWYVSAVGVGIIIHTSIALCAFRVRQSAENFYSGMNKPIYK